MSVGFSPIQVVGLAAGVICLLIVAFRLQRSLNDKLNAAFLLPTGLGLVLISLFPSMAELPADLIDLSEFPGWRLLALSMMAIALIWFLLLLQMSRTKRLSSEINELQIATAVQNFENNLGEEVPKHFILVVMPAYNEANNLPRVLGAMPASVKGVPVRVLVVDDGSRDGTVSVSRACGAWVASHPSRYGGGTAVRTGYRVGFQLGAEYLVTMDADGQHDPKELGELLEPLLSGKSDFTIGSRQLGFGARYSMVRSLGVRLFSAAISVLMNSSVSDCSSGYRAFRMKELEKLNLTSRQYHTAESIIMALKFGLRVSEVPITISSRFSGVSKKGPEALYAFNFLFSIIRAWWR